MNAELSFDLMENMIADREEREEEDERRKKMLRALRRAARGELTPRQAECVRLFYGERISQREIAVRLGVTPPTVSRHLKKARARLARVLRYYF
jgi:RNA polymerase sigma factor (sigma-70 family)